MLKNRTKLFGGGRGWGAQSEKDQKDSSMSRAGVSGHRLWSARALAARGLVPVAQKDIKKGSSDKTLESNSTWSQGTGRKGRLKKYPDAKHCLKLVCPATCRTERLENKEPIKSAPSSVAWSRCPQYHRRTETTIQHRGLGSRGKKSQPLDRMSTEGVKVTKRHPSIKIKPRNIKSKAHEEISKTANKISVHYMNSLLLEMILGSNMTNTFYICLRYYQYAKWMNKHY